MNEKYIKILKIMKEYDSSPVGSEIHLKAGLEIDKEGSKLKERDMWKIIKIYEENNK